MGVPAFFCIISFWYWMWENMDERRGIRRLWEKERKGIWWSRVSLQGWMQGTGKGNCKVVYFVEKTGKNREWFVGNFLCRAGVNVRIQGKNHEI